MNEDLSTPRGRARPLDLDDVDACPVAELCASCPAADGLQVHTVACPVGVYCVTLCPRCSEAGALPPVAGWTGALKLTHDHCGHLGCDVDEMAAAMVRDRQERDEHEAGR